MPGVMSMMPQLGVSVNENLAIYLLPDHTVVINGLSIALFAASEILPCELIATSSPLFVFFYVSTRFNM